jgi:hypothetical protein
MSLHIELYRTNEKGNWDPNQCIEVKTFETPGAAKAWVNKLVHAFNWSKGSYNTMADVISAAEKQYVGTEHDMWHANGSVTRWMIAIEGQFGSKTYEHRYKNLVVEEVILQGDQIQVNGKNLDGENVWMLMHVGKGFTVRQSSVGVDPDS